MEYIANWFGMLVNRFTSFVNLFKSIFSSIGNFFSTLYDIVKGIIFGFNTLVNGLWDLIKEVFTGSIFVRVADAFYTLSNFIGYPATIFMSTLLFIIIVRIGIAFVFKIFRMNIDYHALQSRQHTIKTRDAYNAQIEKQRLFKDMD